MEAQGKKSLMNSHERLMITLSTLESLLIVSETLLLKFKRTEKPLNISDKLSDKHLDLPNLDIVDLFDDVNSKLNLNINKIENNINDVLMMVE